jgi:hypothetical protein
VLRHNGVGAWAGKPLRSARYVLWSPEVDTFTYAIANADEMAERLGAVLDRPAAELQGFITEALEDPELGPRLTRDIGWRVLFMKRRPPLPSHHLSAWAIIRAIKPAIVVETGILDGLGSRTMLRAIQLNQAEGSPGRLISFDVMPGAGALVPERLRTAWSPVYEPTPEAFPAHLDGLEVGLFLHDSVQTAEHLGAEAETILPRMESRGVMMTVAGWTGTLEELGEKTGGRSRTFRERPLDHFYAGRTLCWMRLPDPTEATRP